MTISSSANWQRSLGRPKFMAVVVLTAMAMLLSACSHGLGASPSGGEAPFSPRYDNASPDGALAFFIQTASLTKPELIQQEAHLAKKPASLAVLLKRAILLGHLQDETSLTKALVLAGEVVSSNSSSPRSLAPLSLQLQLLWSRQLLLIRSNKDRIEQLEQQVAKARSEGAARLKQIRALEDKLKALAEIEHNLIGKPLGSEESAGLPSVDAAQP